MGGILTVLSLTLFSWFITSTVKSLGHVPFSVSDTYYALDSKGSIFVVVLLTLSALMLPVLSNFGVIGILSVLGIVAVALCPKFRDSKKQKNIHYTGAIMSLVCSQIIVFKVSLLGYLAWIPVVIWFLWSKFHRHSNKCNQWEVEIFDRTDWLWWIELGSFYSLWLSLLIA